MNTVCEAAYFIMYHLYIAGTYQTVAGHGDKLTPYIGLVISSFTETRAQALLPTEGPQLLHFPPGIFMAQSGRLVYK